MVRTIVKVSEWSPNFVLVRDTLIVNDRVKLAGIPREAQNYVVNGRTPFERLTFDHHLKTARRSGIINDAKGGSATPAT